MCQILFLCNKCDIITRHLRITKVVFISSGIGIIDFNYRCYICLHVEILGGTGNAVADLKQLFSLADKFGYSEWIQFDASIVRGLAYYTGIVFEVRFFVYFYVL